MFEKFRSIIDLLDLKLKFYVESNFQIFFFLNCKQHQKNLMTNQMQN